LLEPLSHGCRLPGGDDALDQDAVATCKPLEELVRVAFADGKLDMNPFLSPEKWPVTGEPLGPPDVLEEYCRVYERTGFRGGINWYRNIDRNWELLAPFAGARVTVPALYVAGDRDLVVAFRGMDQLIPNLSKFVPHLRKTLMLHGCGHWTQQERPQEVNATMIDFLRNL